MVRRLKDISNADSSNSFGIWGEALTTAGGTLTLRVFEVLKTGSAWFEAFGRPSGVHLFFAIYPAINRRAMISRGPSGTGCALTVDLFAAIVTRFDFGLSKQ
jgi:hypothetical protein